MGAQFDGGARVVSGKSIVSGREELRCPLEGLVVP
jgi:hypothetical protein